MRIVFDHGMGAMVGARPAPTRMPGGAADHSGAPGRTSDSVMIIHTGQGARNHRLQNGIPSSPQQTNAAGAAGDANGTSGSEDGIRLPGTDLVMGTSEAAKYRDAEVRFHEKAHLQALGPYAASGVNLITQRGPDGQSYAIGGSVKIDSSPVPGDPEATVRKARSIIHAATAPGNPSAADMRVASQAYRMASAATREIRTKDLLA